MQGGVPSWTLPPALSCSSETVRSMLRFNSLRFYSFSSSNLLLLIHPCFQTQTSSSSDEPFSPDTVDPVPATFLLSVTLGPWTGRRCFRCGRRGHTWIRKLEELDENYKPQRIVSPLSSFESSVFKGSTATAELPMVLFKCQLLFFNLLFCWRFKIQDSLMNHEIFFHTSTSR